MASLVVFLCMLILYLNICIVLSYLYIIIMAALLYYYDCYCTNLYLYPTLFKIKINYFYLNLNF